MSNCDCEMEVRNQAERKTLKTVLAINAVMFLLELVCGIWAQSTGLIADSLDMLADALVYAISLYAVGRSIALKNKAAYTSGYFQITLAIMSIINVIWSFYRGSEPYSELMIVMSIIAAIANIYCLTLINKHKDSGAHMSASWIFTRNDVLVNFGVLISGVLVWYFKSNLPDLIVGIIISSIVLMGGISIIRSTRNWNNNH